MKNTTFLAATLFIGLFSLLACSSNGGNDSWNLDTSVNDNTSGDTGGTGLESCRLVDVIIAVDGSSSMSEEQKAMRETVFPAFAKRLASIGQGLDDFRIATIDACPDPANFHTRGDGGQCNFEGGNAWIESTSSQLNKEFACVGDLYFDDANCNGNNDDEQPISAAARSLEEPYLSGANKGFLRDDALLVVVAITDEDETPTGSAKSATQVYKRLIATKGGNVERVVLLGIGSKDECDGVYGSAWGADLLVDVTNKFISEDRGVFWDLCDGHLEDGLEQAFDVIEQACNEFVSVI